MPLLDRSARTANQRATPIHNAANPTTKPGGVNYTWNNNLTPSSPLQGSLIALQSPRCNPFNDSSANYFYDRANPANNTQGYSRLISTNLGGVTTQFSYNGDGVRLKQIVAGTPTTYTQDPSAGSGQALAAPLLLACCGKLIAFTLIRKGGAIGSP